MKLIILASICILCISCGDVKPKINYEIVNKDDRDPIINLDVYITDTSQIRELNEELKSEYNKGSDKYLGINYIDNKDVAKIFSEKIKDQNISEKDADSLVSHRLASYDYNPSNHFEDFHFEKKKK